MICCTPTITNFILETVTTVPYTGNRPIVTVLYLQPDNTFQEAGILTLIQITATDVIIDHGGVATGLVKLLQ